MGATPEITKAEHGVHRVIDIFGYRSRQWAEAQAKLECLVFKHLGLPWRRADHFVSNYDKQWTPED